MTEVNHSGAIARLTRRLNQMHIEITPAQAEAIVRRLMCVETENLADAKMAATRIFDEATQVLGLPLKRTQAYEALAVCMNHKSWAVYRATLDKDTTAPKQSNSTSPATQDGFSFSGNSIIAGMMGTGKTWRMIDHMYAHANAHPVQRVMYFTPLPEFIFHLSGQHASSNPRLTEMVQRQQIASYTIKVRYNGELIERPPIPRDKAIRALVLHFDREWVDLRQADYWHNMECVGNLMAIVEAVNAEWGAKRLFIDEGNYMQQYATESVSVEKTLERINQHTKITVSVQDRPDKQHHLGEPVWVHPNLPIAEYQPISLNSWFK